MAINSKKQPSLNELIKQYSEQFGIDLPIVSGLTKQEAALIAKTLKSGKPLSADALIDQLDYKDDMIY